MSFFFLTRGENFHLEGVNVLDRISCFKSWEGKLVQDSVHADNGTQANNLPPKKNSYYLVCQENRTFFPRDQVEIVT